MVQPTRVVRFVVAQAIAAVLALALSHVLLSGQLRQLSHQRDQRMGIISLNALASLVQTFGEDFEALRPAIAAWQSAGGAESVRVLRLAGTSLEASTDPGDVGERAAPRRLLREEKAFYDKGQRLRAAVETNRDEGVHRKEELEWEARGNGSVLLAAPLTADGEVVGVVEMIAPRGLASMRPNLPITAVLAFGALLPLALVAVWLRTRREAAIHRWGLVAAGLLGLVGALAAHAAYARTTLRETNQGLLTEIGAHCQQEAARVTRAAAAAGHAVEAAASPGTWDTDVFRQSLGQLSPAGQPSPSAAQVPLGMGRALTLLALLAMGVFLAIGLGGLTWLRHTLVQNRTAYAYIAPAMVGMAVLVFFPFFYGIVLSFTDANLYNASKSIADTWVGLSNYADILFDFSMLTRSPQGELVINYSNFYWTLLFTIIWTVSNVTIGVTVGLALALALNLKGLAFRPIYRVLLILPWAVPNYITALIWKGMFHRQFGVINHLLMLFGGQPRSWFDEPLSSFATALATNGWLSFPFMMVVSLGALQSIPAELYEAAEVDGASLLQRFRMITLPSLRPALVPAIILSVVWTFNMFNIIYLVTGGEPGRATEILVTQAYKHAFERYRYGYAAAYTTIIFLILLVYGVFQNRVSKATEA